MRSTPLAIAVIALAAAAGTGCDEGEPPLARVSMDVIVDGDIATIFVRPLERDCTCNIEAGLEGTCAQTFTDVTGCTCGGVSRAPVDNEAILGCVSGLQLDAPVAIDDALVGVGMLGGRIGADGDLVVTG